MKKRLFQCLRSKLSADWPHYLPFVVSALNERPLQKLGFLSPSDIQSSLDDVKVQQALKAHKLKSYSQPDWRTQEKNQSSYENSNSELQVGKYVYKDEPRDVFSKSFHTQVKKNLLISFFLFQ